MYKKTLFVGFSVAIVVTAVISVSRAASVGVVGEVVRCESEGERYNFCSVDTSGGVTLKRQLSQSECIKGRTWGYDRRGIWVDNGCRAEFYVSGGKVRRGHERTIRCESRDMQYEYCDADTRRGVRLLRQLSDASCNYGDSWGYDRFGIWVNYGCRAEFSVIE